MCYQAEIDEWDGTPSVRLRLCDLATAEPLAPPSPLTPGSLEMADGADENGQCSLF